MKAPNFVYLFLAILFLILIAQIFTKRGFVILGGGGNVVLSFFLLLQILYAEKLAFPKLIIMFQFIYRSLGILLLVELILIFCGFQNKIALHVQNYKTYVSFDFLKFIPYLNNVGGLNSILLGSQSAGMLSLLGLIQEIYYFKNQKYKRKNQGFWLCLYIFLFFITLGGTTTFLFFISSLCYIFLKRNKKTLLYALITWIIILFLIFRKNIFDRMTIIDEKLLLQYLKLDPNADIAISGFQLCLWVFYWPFWVWYEGKKSDKILGFGANQFLEMSDSLFGDCSFLVDILFKCGLVWLLTFSFFTLFPVIKKIMIRKQNPKREVWEFQASNSICIIVLFFSLVHYGQAIHNAGFIFLFGLHYASILYSNKFLNEQRVY